MDDIEGVDLAAQRQSIRRDELAALARVLRETGSGLASIVREVSAAALPLTVKPAEIRRWLGASRRPS